MKALALLLIVIHIHSTLIQGKCVCICAYMGGWVGVKFGMINRPIKTRGSGSRGQEEAACVRHQAYATTTVSYLHK